MGGGESGRAARERMRDESLAAPELLYIEVVSAYRGFVRARKLHVGAAARALARLSALPIQRSSHHVLIERCWELRNNLTSYDASYVALAELLDVPFVTTDTRIAGAPGLRCLVEVLS